MQKALPVAALLFATLACAAAGETEWGQTVDGLRMSVAVAPNSRGDVQVRVTINYAGDKPLLLPFGFITGEVITRYRLRLLVAAPDGQHTFTLDPGGALRGRFEPLVIPMVPQASYSLELPLATWRTGKGRKDEAGLDASIPLQGQLWAELDCKNWFETAVPSVTCPLYGYPNPNGIVCWQGTLTSNKLQLPR